MLSAEDWEAFILGLIISGQLNNIILLSESETTTSDIDIIID